MFSQTCTRLQALCDNHFRRKYPNEGTNEVEMEVEDNEIIYRGRNDYIKYFFYFIQNVKIYASESKCTFNQNNEWAQRMADFFEFKCSRKLHRICVKGYMELLPWCKEIEHFLCNVEIVECIDDSRRGQDMLTFLKFCPNVKKLILNGCIHVENVDAVLGQKYEQLTHFSYINGGQMHFNPEQLKIFFETNHKVQCVALKCVDRNDDLNLVTSRNVNYFQTMATYATNLKHLFLTIGGTITKCFDSVCSQLNILCERDNFQSLVMRFDYDYGANTLQLYSNRMANWKQLTKVYLMRIRLIDVIPALRSLVHLKILVLTEDGWFMVPDTNHMDNFDKIIDTSVGTQNFALPQVEEVLIDCMKNSLSISNLLMLFTRHWSSLKRVLVPSNGCDVQFDVAGLIRARKKLESACDVTIFTNHDGNSTNLQHDLIKLKIVEFNRINVFDDSRLFQRWFMVPE